MRKCGWGNNFIVKLAIVGMTFVMVGCGAGSDAQKEAAGTEQTAEAEMAAEESAAEEQDAVQEPDQAAVQNPQELEWDAADE